MCRIGSIEMTFKEMKIEVNEQQPLFDVFIELERLGYTGVLIEPEKTKGWVLTHSNNGIYTNFKENPDKNHGELTTLEQLREMK